MSSLFHGMSLCIWSLIPRKKQATTPLRDLPQAFQRAHKQRVRSAGRPRRSRIITRKWMPVCSSGKSRRSRPPTRESGPVIDVTPNLIIWLTSLPRGTVLCIMQNLSKVLDTERTILAPSNQCAANSQLSSFDLFLYFGIPVYMMSIHYLWHLDYRLSRLHIDTRNLSKCFLDPERTVLIPSKPMHRKQLAFELFLCFGIPLYMTFIHTLGHLERHIASLDRIFIF